MTAKPILAAGVVLIRGTLDADAEVLVIHRPQYDDWSLPKGKDDPGETAEAAALRELYEETGYRASLVERLDDQHYVVSGGRPKVVRYFLARPTRYDGFKPNSEVDRFEWVTFKKARKMLTYARDQDMLDDKRVKAAVRTGTVHLIRHAHAGSRERWRDDDRLRPLSKKGVRQARTIGNRLTLRGVDVIHSSPYIRCVETVRPLAERLGIPVLDSDELAEGGDGDATLDLISGASGLRIALCSHGDVIPDVVQGLVRRGIELISPNGRLEFGKGSVWEITVSKGTPTTAMYHPPPGG